jgi:hypothetical protein
MMLASFILATVLSSSKSAISRDLSTHCGATKAKYGMDLGIVQPVGGRPHMRSLAAIAAIYRGTTRHYVGWIAWDNVGHPWIELLPDSGLSHDFEVLERGPLFSSLDGNYLRIPAGYTLAACSFAT